MNNLKDRIFSFENFLCDEVEEPNHHLNLIVNWVVDPIN